MMREEIETILNRWTDAEEIRLRAGEIDPETMRTVLAVTNAMARGVREALTKTLAEHENELNRWRGALGNADAERDRLRKFVGEDVLDKANFYLDDLPSNPPCDPKTARELIEGRRIDREEKKDEYSKNCS